MKKFKKVGVGGTFDQLHRGHRILINQAFKIGEKVAIGLTSDEMVKRLNKPHITASYDERQKFLISWLENSGWEKRAEFVPMYDTYGSSVNDIELEALVVSDETAPMAKKINDQRKKAGLPILTIFSVSMVPSENCGPISTTRIRRGEMDREGRLLKKNKCIP
ncbi:MAG: pantetheine-phosphate adenylyltransferase [Crenarchaeota archaeon]|nr:pantetheine-phosphate adenylyltransferase [Thermoproteota archaeon]